MMIKILELDKPTNTGRVYPESVIRKAIEEYKNRPLPVTLGLTGKVELDKWAGIATNLQIKDHALWANIHLQDTPIGLTVERKMKKPENFRVGGTGSFQNDKVNDYHLLQVGFVEDDDGKNA